MREEESTKVSKVQVVSRRGERGESGRNRGRDWNEVGRTVPPALVGL